MACSWLNDVGNYSKTRLESGSNYKLTPQFIVENRIEVFCEICLEGYALNLDGKCYQCPDKTKKCTYSNKTNEIGKNFFIWDVQDSEKFLDRLELSAKYNFQLVSLECNSGILNLKKLYPYKFFI